MDPSLTFAFAQDSTIRAAYEVLDELGRGSFGQVLRARQRSTGRDVAIKLARPPASDQPLEAERRRERFKRELRLCAQLSHPNIVRLLDTGESADGTLYAVFEHVAGMTLKDVLANEGKLEVPEAAHLLGQVLDALSCAHALSIVHRDVTPSNIMIAKTGIRRNALVLDFGLGGFEAHAGRPAQARITATHELLGTPCYAAPEQLRGDPPSFASDLYSWGLVLLESVTGELPFRGSSAHDVIHQQLGPDPITIPRWLRSHPLGRVIESVVAKQPGRRATDVEALHAAITSVATGRDGSSAAVASVPIERERRQLTVTCARLTVAATVERELDVEELDRLIRMRHAAIAARAEAARGSVVAVLADRIFIVHGYPQAHEGDARRAARMAMEIVRANEDGPAADADGPPRCIVRIGMHTGLVIVPDPRRSDPARAVELTGLTPQIASCLADLAGEGEVLASFDTSQLVRAEFHAELAGECSLSELSRPIATYRLRSGAPPAVQGAPVVKREPTLVGRSRELERLLEGWAGATRRKPGVVLITGEAGIGKSRLLRELRQRVGREAWLTWECTAEGQTTPLRPVVDALGASSEPLETLLATVGMSAGETSALLALAARSALAPDPERIDVSPDRQKSQTIEAILTLTLKLAERAPLVLAVENLHWADPTTIELLRALAMEVGASRVGDPHDAPPLFVVLTSRPDFVPDWTESLSFLPLQRLKEDEVVAMVRESLGDAAPTASLLEAVIRRAEGVPLFVEEIARLVDETQRRAASRSGTGRDLPAVVPTTVRDLLTARMDAVSATARETARLASALGREFSIDLLRAISDRDDTLVRRDVGELVQAGLVLLRRAGGGERCVFRHALLQDAAYEALTRPSREELHRRVARVLRSEFGDVARLRPELVALHHERGGEPQPAADYWMLAGAQSYRAAAYVEALTQLERGLTAVRCLDGSLENRSREVGLLVAYGTALLSTRGWADPEVEPTFQRAIDLAETTGSPPPLMALYGLWGVLITSSNRSGVERFLPRIEALLAGTDDRVVRHFCLSILGIAASWRGEIALAHELLDRALASYDEEAAYAAYDGGMYTYAFHFCNLLWMGRADRARALRDEAFALAQRRRDPYSLGVVLAFGGILAQGCGDEDAMLAYGEQLMALSTTQQLPAFWCGGACGYGAGLVLKGKVQEGLRFIRDGIDRYRAFGILGSYSSHMTYLAGAHLELGQTDEAMAAVDEGIALCGTLYARFHEPELWRLRGEILLRRGELDAAETSFRRAFATAEASGALVGVLRAATSSARLLRERGLEDRALATLRPVYERFTEGLDIRDVRDARALLDALELRSSA